MGMRKQLVWENSIQHIIRENPHKPSLDVNAHQASLNPSPYISDQIPMVP